MSFCVVRHPDVAVPGTAPEEALEVMRANGWVRVSDFRPWPTDFDLSDYADAKDLDAEATPEPTPDYPADETEESTA